MPGSAGLRSFVCLTLFWDSEALFVLRSVWFIFNSVFSDRITDLFKWRNSTVCKSYACFSEHVSREK